MSLLKKALSFMQLMHDFQKVERVTPVPHSDRRENDVEHSYFLAMLAWYIVDREQLDLDVNRVITYALIHDLVEVYAGDTFAYGPNKNDLKTKHEREAKAQKQLAKEFADFAGLHDSINTYEKGVDKESRFVRALDKCIASMTVYLSHSTLWKDHGITFADHNNGHKAGVVATHPKTQELYQKMLTLMKKEEARFFKTLLKKKS